MSMIYLGRLGEGELFSDGPRVSAAAAQWIGDAQALVEAARDEAREIVAAAYTEAEMIRRHAQEQGQAQGLAQGQQEMSARLLEIAVNADRYVHDLEPVLVDAVTFAVGKLVGDVGFAPLIERAVLCVRERIGNADGLTLRVPPPLVATAQEATRALIERHGLLLPLRVEADPGLAHEQCVVESSLGRAQLRLDEQLERLRQAVSDAFGSAGQQP